ncbi:hypothetical protein FC093_12475 [Ilyomonas limi]|uniref:Asl1-like glycosyl hydrolase catalytic domain-containing protein n=1 Tax=Ilyomonas limi TaxID=2575867 RepID=A0A4U3KZW3_9BACT|nr:hypothetical protein [Ilyomonas limi]TKK68022.1 hypothetical protein FC093_12475 [Ilyomonas limi]
MKKYYSLAVACIALFLCSCSKEDLNGTVTNSTTSANASTKAEGSILTLIPNKSLNYGALIGAPSVTGSIDFQLNVADDLGVSCLRERTNVPSNTPDPIVVKSNYKVLLNFCRGSFSSGTPMPFVTNLTQYKKDLKSTLAVYTVNPAVAVIENEESNKLYYSGSAQQYINQLKAAISVMHGRGIKVANGGITSTGLNYLVYQDFMNQGKTDSAERFKQLTGVAPKALTIQERGRFVDTLLQAYATINLDYVNFHWKGTSPNTEALQSVINYMKKRTNKPVISNEFGQFDKEVVTLQAMLQVATDNNLPYVVWYSPDENAGKKDTPLHHSDQSLTPNGFAYKDYLKN